MFIIVETTQYKETQNITTSFGNNLYYNSYDEVEKDLGQLITCNLPEGEVATIIRQADAVTLDLPDKIYTVSIEVLTRKEKTTNEVREPEQRHRHLCLHVRD